MTNKRDAARNALQAAGPLRTSAGMGTRPDGGTVRTTLDLDAAQHRYVRMLAAGVGRSGVPTVEVFRAVIDLLEDDAELRDRVLARVDQRLHG